MTDRERFRALGELLLYHTRWQKPVAKALGVGEYWVRSRVNGTIRVKPEDVRRMEALLAAHIEEMTNLARA